ncbi:hypothetical protein N9D31_01270 [Oligoflexaceae bacterium]|nr:hypothetical protein [Oligoflexaceae bacterium]
MKLPVILLLCIAAYSCKVRQESTVKATTATQRVGPVIGLSASGEYLTLLDRFPYSIGKDISFPLHRLGLSIEGYSKTDVVSRVKLVPNFEHANLQIYSAIRQNADYDVKASSKIGSVKVIEANTKNQISSIIDVIIDQNGVKLSGPQPLNPKVKTAFVSNLPPLLFKGTAERKFKNELPAIEAGVQQSVWSEFESSVRETMDQVEVQINESWQKNVISPLFKDPSRLSIGQGLAFSSNNNHLRVDLEDYTLASQPKTVPLPFASVQLNIHPDFFNNFFSRYIRAGRLTSADIRRIFSMLPLVDSLTSKQAPAAESNEELMGINLIGEQPIVAEISRGALVFFVTASFFQDGYETRPVTLAIPYYPKQLIVEGYWSVQIGEIQIAELYRSPESKSKLGQIKDSWVKAGEFIAIKRALLDTFPNDLISRNIVVARDDDRPGWGWTFTARYAKTEGQWLNAAWGLEYAIILD